MSEVTQRKCKTIISLLQIRIETEGRQVIPMLTYLWKEMEHSSGSTDNLDLRKIDLRLEKFEYAGVVDFVSDVQLMLKRGMQHYGFAPEVSSEAEKVHDLLFEILKIVFPEEDLREIRSSLSFSGPGVTTATVAGSSSRYTPTDQNKHLKAPIQSIDCRIKLKRHMPQEKPRLRSGELVNGKKKRNDGEKSSGGPPSPGGIMSSSSGSAKQQQNMSGGSGCVGWSNPVNRMRTDGGRRRPSHM